MCHAALKNEVVCLTLDGWCNVNNTSIICACVVKKNGLIVLVDTIDTSGHKHDSDYLQALTTKICRETEIRYECKIRSLVSDNASNMTSMRKDLEDMPENNIISYGCSAHILNLLAHDLGKDFLSIQKHIVRVAKYFRNHHLAKSWYVRAGGRSLVLPIEVHWSSIRGTIKSYLKNWSVLMTVCDEHRDEIDIDVIRLVQNLGLKRNCEDLLLLVEPIAGVLDIIQSDTTKISDSVVVWKRLYLELRKNLNDPQKKQFDRRYTMALNACHYAAFLISPNKM